MPHHLRHRPDRTDRISFLLSTFSSAALLACPTLRGFSIQVYELPMPFSMCLEEKMRVVSRGTRERAHFIFIGGDILLCARTRIYSEDKITANSESIRLSTLVSLFFLVPCRLGLEQLRLRTDINLFFVPGDRHQPTSILPINVTRLPHASTCAAG